MNLTSGSFGDTGARASLSTMFVSVSLPRVHLFESWSGSSSSGAFSDGEQLSGFVVVATSSSANFCTEKYLVTGKKGGRKWISKAIESLR